MRTIDITKFPEGKQADDAGVDRFAAAMRAKMKRKRIEGRGGWNKPIECSTSDLRRMLLDHFDGGHGDMIDIANFAMMIWNREHVKGQR